MNYIMIRLMKYIKTDIMTSPMIMIVTFIMTCVFCMHCKIYILFDIHGLYGQYCLYHLHEHYDLHDLQVLAAKSFIKILSNWPGFWSYNLVLCM